MSAFSSIAVPGRIPVSGSGSGSITPESLFKSKEERSEYSRLLDGFNGTVSNTPVCVNKVKVEIFDLSDPKQVSEYEKLWKRLLEKTYKMEVIVDSRKDLVQRPDGTSYWMKYVEYVEFDVGSEKNQDNKE